MLISGQHSELTTALVRVARLYRLGVDEALSGIDLSDALALPVVIIGRHPEGIRQNVLAMELGVEGPSLVRLLDRLMHGGLVERREDSTDRRAKTVHLTDAGRLHSKRATAALDAFRNALLGNLPGSDLEAMLRVLRTIEQRLQTARREGR
jgi:MarR family transcriptional regulator for hemolysin